MQLENTTAGIVELKKAARLQVWSLTNLFTKEGFTPFQIAYFFERVADASLSIAEQLILENSLETKMAETRPSHDDELPVVIPIPTPPKTPVKRTRTKRCPDCGMSLRKDIKHTCPDSE